MLDRLAPTTIISCTYQIPSISRVNTSRGLRFGDRDPTCAFDICKGTYHPTRGVPYPVAMPPYCVNCNCLGNPTLLHTSRGLMEYGSWEQTLFDIPSGHCWSEGFSVMVEPCVCSAVSLAQKYGRRAAPPPGNLFFILRTQN